MYTVKIRDHLTARTRELVTERGLRVLAHDADKWQACIIRYATYDEALAFVESQLKTSNGNNRFALRRDHRIFEQNGRKQTLVYEHLSEGE